MLPSSTITYNLKHWKNNFVRCGGSLLAHQASGAEVTGSNPASPIMILMRCRFIVYPVENLRVERETYTAEANKTTTKKQNNFVIIFQRLKDKSLYSQDPSFNKN